MPLTYIPRMMYKCIELIEASLHFVTVWSHHQIHSSIAAKKRLGRSRTQVCNHISGHVS